MDKFDHTRPVTIDKPHLTLISKTSTPDAVGNIAVVYLGTDGYYGVGLADAETGEGLDIDFNLVNEPEYEYKLLYSHGCPSRWDSRVASEHYLGKVPDTDYSCEYILRREVGADAIVLLNSRYGVMP